MADEFDMYVMKNKLDRTEKELAEAKRLLKQALSVMNNGGCNANCYKCKHKGECDYSQRFEWDKTDEVEKLLGEEIQISQR